MKMLRWSTAIIATAIILLLVYTWTLSLPLFDESLDEQRLGREIQIAPVDQALTFARLLSGKPLLVVSANGDGVGALDLQLLAGRPFVDGIDAYGALGVAELRALVSTQGQQAQLYRWEQLGIPVDESYPHIGVGTNYRAHADEVGHAGEPFVFPKFAHITAWNAGVSEGARLDYEVELCAVLLTDHSAQHPAKLGYILCGDYTDRWLLVKEMDLGGPMGSTGFAAGKGGDSRFPVGSLLVIPEAEDFYQDIELKLYLNGDLRQRASAGLMTWGPHQALDRALASCRVPYFRGAEETVVTPSCERVTARTLVLTGTPEGVLFNIATLWNPLAYMQAGDELVITGTYLGVMRNKIFAARE